MASRSDTLKVGVLRLQPCPRPAADITRSNALRDYAFEPQTAGVAEDAVAVARDRLLNSFGNGRDEALATHPTIKPVALVADALRDCTSKGDLVLDPFLGAGTTVLAAEKVGRVCYGLEYEAAYVDSAVRRWQAYTGIDAVLDGDGRTFDEIHAERAAARAEAAGAAGPDKRDIDSPGGIGSTGEDWVRLCEPNGAAAQMEGGHERR